MVLTVSFVVVFIEYGRGYYDGGYTIDAVFPASSQGLFTDGGSDVKVRGLNVGTVSGIQLLDDGRARITLKLDDGVQIPDTAVASIEPLSVFGPKFVRIDPGAHEQSGPYLRPDDVITDTHTSVELVDTLDNATRLLDEVNPGELASILTAVAESVDGMGAEIGSSIDDTGQLLAIGAAHASDIEQFLGDVARITGVGADHADDIVSTVTDLNALLPTFTAHADDLTDLLDVTDRISSTFSGLLQDHADDIDAVIRTLAGFVNGVYDEAEHIPDILDLVGTFFGRLSDVIRMPAAEHKQMAALRGFIALDLCMIFNICLAPGGDQ
jgi:phospholipid/cholesterol/gamma-HCH transport system substrate-binding protein